MSECRRYCGLEDAELHVNSGVVPMVSQSLNVDQLGQTNSCSQGTLNGL